jgi:hypothetical protein
MHDAVRVELVPLMVPTDDGTRAARQNVVDRLADLGQIDPATGEIPDRMRQGWKARINGAEFPVVTFSVEPGGEGGNALVSLLIPADAVQVGDPSTGVAPPQVRPAVEEKPAVSTWGAKTADPRESIPGWKPESSLGAQVAENAALVHDHALRNWTCGCDPVLLGIQDAAAKTGNVDLRVVQA